MLWKYRKSRVSISGPVVPFVPFTSKQNGMSNAALGLIGTVGAALEIGLSSILRAVKDDPSAANHITHICEGTHVLRWISVQNDEIRIHSPGNPTALRRLIGCG